MPYPMKVTPTSEGRQDSEAAHKAKLRRMTADYGAADPKTNKSAPGLKVTRNGGQDSVGFGEGPEDNPNRGDRARRTTAANPIATYKRGGRVKSERQKAYARADGGSIDADPAYLAKEAREAAATRTRNAMSRDVKEVSPEVLTGAGPAERARLRAQDSRIVGYKKGGAVESGSVIARARGGRTNKAKGATHVNVIVAPQSGNQPQTPPPLPVGLTVPPGGPPGAVPGPAGIPPGAPPGLGAAPRPMPPPGAVPPGLGPMRKRGGRIKMTAGAESGVGRLQKAAIQRAADR